MRSSSNVASWTKLYLATTANHVTICGLDRAQWMLRILLLIFNIMNLVLALLHLIKSLPQTHIFFLSGSQRLMYTLCQVWVLGA